MGRRRDDEDEDEEYDDRPSRRRGNRPAKKNNLPMILGIVGVIVVLVIAACGGMVYYAVSSAKKIADDVSGRFASVAEADSFLDKLSDSKVQTAYDSTSPSFKAATSFVQFQQLIDKNPLMKKPFSHYSVTSAAPTGVAPNRVQTISYEITDSDDGEVGDFGDDPDMQPPPPAKRPKVAKPGNKPGTPALKSLTVTITLAEQPGGFWKVEKFTIP